MPIYQYECENCGEVIDKVRGMANREMPVVCPVCDGACLPVVTKPGRFQRGPGWHARMDGAAMPGKV